MQYKKILKESSEPLSELLPYGAITKLSEKHNITRQNVPLMLQGKFGEAEKLLALVEDAINMIIENANEEAQKKRKAIRIKRRLSKAV